MTDKCKEEFERWLRNERKVTMPELAYTFNPGLWEAFKTAYNLREQEIQRLREALELLVHLHSCEQEGISSGMPTPKQWYDAVRKAEQALQETTNKE